MNAYELADELEDVDAHRYREIAANMLRQQADRIAHLEMLVANRNEIIDKLDLTPQTKPLSDEEIKELINNFPIIFSPQDLLSFARAIEERHGIK